MRPHVRPDMPGNVVAIGKCAGALLDGVAAVHPVQHAFVALPDGYRRPRSAAEVHVGGHPRITQASFDAGCALLAFVEAHDDILFLVSGGGSACVEVPLLDGDAVIRRNDALIASGMPIHAINAERRTMSAIKGGRLAARVRGRAVTLVYSDVSTGALADVASGPTLPGSEAVLVADNTTLARTAARLAGEGAILIDAQIETDVDEAARFLAFRASTLRPGEVLVAGGEPTVVVRGDGKGGRCSELAVRFLAHASRISARHFRAVFASSDGVDGNSGAAGIALAGADLSGLAWEESLTHSDSYSIAAQVGEPIMIPPTGNNLRDLFLVACD